MYKADILDGDNGVFADCSTARQNEIVVTPIRGEAATLQPNEVGIQGVPLGQIRAFRSVSRMA